MRLRHVYTPPKKGANVNVSLGNTPPRHRTIDFVTDTKGVTVRWHESNAANANNANSNDPSPAIPPPTDASANHANAAPQPEPPKTQG